MSYRFEATSDFFRSVLDVDTILGYADDGDSNRDLFLKLATVTLVTKFQVFVEKALEEFRYELNEKPSRALSTYSLMNSLKLSLQEDNALTGLVKHANFTDEKRGRIIGFLNSISYISDAEQIINEAFRFRTKFPLGKTGKNELIDLLKQIDGDSNPFVGFGDERIEKLDSLLQTRHLIIHQDRYNGTKESCTESITFLRELVTFIDSYLNQKMNEINQRTDEA